MGLFSKKKTTTQVKVEKITATKIVKLSYTQSVLINGGTAEVSEFAGITGPSEEQLSATDSSRRNQAARANNAVLEGLSGRVDSFTANALNAAYNAVLFGVPSIVSSLFGRKVKRSVRVDSKESGWSIVKTWAQPEFDIIRYAIGIKDIGVSQFNYANVSEMISKPWSSPKEVIKIRLLVEQFIPSEYPTGTYIEYYIKPGDSEDKWIRINPIELPTAYSESNLTKPIPRIISFNSERPINAREEESYILTSRPVKSVRLKIIIKRPENSLSTSTPIVRNYKLLMTPKNGL